MADRRASQVKSVEKAEKKRREEERKARVAARVKFESERTKEDLTKRGAPKKVKRGKSPEKKKTTSGVSVKPESAEEALRNAGKRRIEKALEESKAKKKRKR